MPSTSTRWRATSGTIGTWNAYGVERTWNAGNGGTFNVAANWLAGVAPVSNDVAVFNLADTGYTVTFTANATNIGLAVRNDTVTFDLGGFTYTTPSGNFTSGGSGDISRLTLTNGTLSLAGTNTLGGASG